MTKEEFHTWCDKLGAMIKDQRGQSIEDFADHFKKLEDAIVSVGSTKKAK